MAKKFLFSVADVWFYRTNSNDLIFTSQTLVDSSIEATIQNEDARAGKGNSLQFVYYHSSELNVTLTEQQFNMKMLAPSIGSYLTIGDIIQVTEEVVLKEGGAGTVTQGLPVNSKYVKSNKVTGTVTIPDDPDVMETVTFNGENFTYASGNEGDKVCVIYNILSATTESIEVSANMIPSVGRLVMKAQLGSSETGYAESSSSVIGEVEIEIPSLQLNPSGIGMQMTSSGISQSQLTGRALAYTVAGGCNSKSAYASIKETIYGNDMYTNALALVCTNSEITLTEIGKEEIVELMVVPKAGSPFRPDVSDIVFASSDSNTVTVGVNTGVVTAVAEGNATITATLTKTDGTALTATCQVTVSVSSEPVTPPEEQPENPPVEGE